ncbi:hypothetical protein PYV02_03895 [Leifsonia sp. H3M29-4]|jgi:hypothetical protein|nr:hypothetical protein [Salinibacterium metalliresistens]MDF1478218.1 hypothetical protein [Salinibacterium metalliresistens]
MSDRETEEWGAGVDRDTGARVGDTGTPDIDEEDDQAEVDDELSENDG